MEAFFTTLLVVIFLAVLGFASFVVLRLYKGQG
jgi:hypothetical protein